MIRGGSEPHTVSLVSLVSLTDAELALTAAQAGAAVVRARYGAELTRIAKTATDFATDADVDAERAILQVLRTARPADDLVGEESGALAGSSSASDSGSPAGADRIWLVDPLCGTLNYAAQTPLVAVNVALSDASRVVAAACADPIASEVFWTDGQHAWRRGTSDESLQPSAASGLVDLNVDPPHPNADRFQVAALLSDSRFNAAFRPRVLSTTLALAWVAAGRRAAYVTDGDLRASVHFSAGIGLCQAAGCTVTGLLGQPLHTGVGGLIAAADPETHGVLVEIIREQFASSR